MAKRKVSMDNIMTLSEQYSQKNSSNKNKVSMDNIMSLSQKYSSGELAKPSSKFINLPTADNITTTSNFDGQYRPDKIFKNMLSIANQPLSEKHQQSNNINKQILLPTDNTQQTNLPVSDADKYGTFSNGYQPKGINGHGNLSKTGQTINVQIGESDTYNELTGKKDKVFNKQNVWKAEDGTKWVWDGTTRTYKPYGESAETGLMTDISKQNVLPVVERGQENVITNAINASKLDEQRKKNAGIGQTFNPLRSGFYAGKNILEGFKGSLPQSMEALNSWSKGLANQLGMKAAGKILGIDRDNEIVQNVSRATVEKIADNTAGEQLNDIINSEEAKQLRNEKIQQNIIKAEREGGQIGKYLAEQAPSIGNNLFNMAISAVNPVIGTTSFITSAAGGYLDEGRNLGMTEDQALMYSLIMGAVEGGTESVISGSMLESGAKLFGVNGVAKEGLHRVVNSFGFNVLENFAQEALTEPLNEWAKETVGAEADWENIGQRALKAGLDGVISSIILSGASIGINSSIYAYEKVQKGEQLTQKEIKKIVTDAEKAGIPVNEMLKEGIKENIEAITAQGNINQASQSNISDFNNQVQQTTQEYMNQAQNQVREQTSNIVQDLINYNNSRQEGQEIFDLNNEQNKNELSAIQKIANDRGINIQFDENRFNDNTRNAFYEYDNNGNIANIVLNPNSSTKKYVQDLVVHELVHSFSGNQKTNLMKDVLNYAKTLEGFDKAYQDIRQSYEEVYGKNVSEDIINEEVVANILGQKLGSQEFINDLVNGKYATQNRNWVQKIYDFVKNQINRFRGYKDQERYWTHIKEMFDDAYRNSEINKGDQRFSKVLQDIILRNKNLNDKSQISVVDSAEQINYSNQNIQRLQDDMRNNVKTGIYKNNATDYEAIINSRTLGKIMRPTSNPSINTEEYALRMIAGNNLPELFRNAVYIDTIENQKNKTNSIGYHHFVAPINIDGNTYRVLISGKESENSKRLHSLDIEILGQKNSSNTPANVSKTNTRFKGYAPTTLSIADLVKDVKLYDYITGKNKNYNINDIKFSVETRNDGTLLALHNLTEDKLRGVLELGGFPVPSIAITNQPHTQFGDISVVFDKNTIDPANIENEVYDRDVWSPTFPRVDYDISNSDIKKYVSKDLDLYSKDDIINRAVTNYFYDTNLLDKIDSRGIEGTLESIKNSKEMKYLYLNKVANQEFTPIMKQAEFSRSNDYGNIELQKFLDWYKGTPLNELSFDEKMALGEKISEIVKEKTEADLEKSFNNSDLTNTIKDSIKKFSLQIADNYKENFGKIDNFIYSAISMQRNGADYQVIDEEKTLDKADTIINQKEYEQWVDSTFGELFKNTKKGIRNKKDAYTNSGNRRSFNQLHDDYNLSNIVKAMVAERTTGVDNFSVSGFGTIQAKRAKQFDSIQDIKNNEELLTSSELTPDILEPLKDDIVEDIEILSKYYNSSGYSSGFDNAANAISEFAGKKNLTPEAFKKVLKTYYNFDIDSIPEDFIREVISDLHSLENIQTDYFEAKPQRAVGLDEIKAMVIPNDMNTELKQQLQDMGIRLVEYDRNIEGDREAKLKSAELQDLRFSKDTSGDWDNFLEKNFKKEGTGTSIKDMKVLPTKQITMQDFEDLIDEYNFPAKDANDLKNDLKYVELNKQSLDEFKDFLRTYNEAYQETLQSKEDEVLDTTKTYSTGRKEIYRNYLNDNSKYDKTALEKAKNAVPGKQGRRTKEQWLLVARQIGTEIANKSNEEIEKIAYRSWIDEAPNQKSQLNRQGEKFVKFNSDDWINAIYNQVKDVRQSYSIETNLPTAEQSFSTRQEINLPVADLSIEKASEDFEDSDLQAIRENSIGNLLEKGKSRKHYETYSQTESLSTKDRNAAKKLYEQEQYIPVGNIDSLTEANSRIQRNGLDNEYTAMSVKFNDNEKMTLDDIVTMERMIQIYSAQGDSAKVNNLMQNVAIMGTELGQRVQALSIIKRMSPEGQLQLLNKLVERTNQKENSNLKITDEQADRILKSNGEKELNDNVTKVVEEIAQDLEVTFGDEVRAWRYLSMLGNPRTHIRNLLGNVAMNTLQNSKNKLAGAGEDLASLINPNLERTKTLRMANQDQRDFAKKDAFLMEDMIDGGGKYDMKNILQEAKRTSKSKVLNAIEKFNSNLLDKEDKIFLRKAYEQAMRGYMAANKLSSKDMEDSVTLEKARKYATLQAQEATFHQYSALASKISQIEREGGAMGFLTSAILPFKKTPINIAKTGIEYSPIGIISSVGNTIKNVNKDTKTLRTQLQDGKITQEQYNSEISNMVNKRIDQMSKGLTGTALAVLGYALAKQGILKAGNGDDEDEFEEKLGKQTYSVTIGDNNFSLDWLAPSAIPLFVGANFSYLANGDENSTDDETMYDRLGKSLNTSATSLMQAFEPMTEMSMLQGLASTLSSYEQDSSNKLFDIGSSAIQSYAGQFVPTALGQVAKTIDPTVRDTTSTKKGVAKKIDQFINQTKNKIPGLSYTLPVKTDVWGEEKTRPENIIVRSLENAVLPYNREQIIEDTTSKKLKEVYEETGTKGVLPSTPQKYITLNSQRYDLNNADFNKSKKVYGQTAKTMLDEVIDNSNFTKLSSESKAKIIGDIYLYAKEEFKLDYAERHNIDYTAKVRNSSKKYEMFKNYENGNTSLKSIIDQYYKED